MPSNSIVEENTTRDAYDSMARLLGAIQELCPNHSQLLDSIVDQTFEHTPNEADAELMTEYQYLLRVVLRLRTNSEWGKRGTNLVSEDATHYVLSNYDYKTYVWAKKNSPGNIDNICVRVQKEGIEPAIEAHFEIALRNRNRRLE